MLRTKTKREPSRARRAPVLGAIGAAVALVASAFVPMVAHAAPPQAGTYEGDSDAYTGATVSFEIDSDGMMSNFDSESYCFDGLFTQPVQWVGMPPTQVEAGQSFDVYWEYGTDDFRPYYELQGVVNADGSASGTGRAGFLPSGSCGGFDFNWTANNTGGGDPDPVDPEIQIVPDSVTESELTDPGVVIEGEGFSGSSWVELFVNGAYSHRTQSAWDGSVTVFYDSADLGVGAHELLLTDGGSSATATLTVTEDPVVYDPTASVTPQELTESELAGNGVTVSGADFPPGDEIALSVGGAEVTTETANSGGEVSFTYTSDSLGTGTHQATLTSGDLSATTSFTVTEDPVVYDPTATVSPESLTESELADTGITITGEDFPAGDDVTLSISGTEVGTATANASGGVSFPYTSDSLGAGSHQVTLISGDLSATASFTVTEDPVVYDPTATATPEELTESELADTGITITGEGFPEDSEVALTINAVAIGTATSNDAGEITFVFTSDSLGAGTHTVELSADGDGASTRSTFTVTEDAPEPDTIPGTDPTEDDLDPALEGAITAPAEAEAGDPITVAIEGVEPGTEVGVWLFSDPVYLGTQTVDAEGVVVVTIPTHTELGDHTIAVWAAPDTQVGWTDITVVASDDEGDGDDTGNGDDTGDGGDAGNGGEDGTGGDGDTDADTDDGADADAGSDDGTGDGSADGSGDGGLPATGVSPTLLIALSTMLLAFGAALAWHTNRRRARS